MRLTRLALCLALAACGSSKKPATMPADTAAPTGGAESADGAAPPAEAEATKAEPAMAPGAPAPAGASAPADAPKPTTRGAVKKPASGDPDAGGE
jgi:hypothetical protein